MSTSPSLHGQRDPLHRSRIEARQDKPARAEPLVQELSIQIGIKLLDAAITNRRPYSSTK